MTHLNNSKTKVNQRVSKYTSSIKLKEIKPLRKSEKKLRHREVGIGGSKSQCLTTTYLFYNLHFLVLKCRLFRKC